MAFTGGLNVPSARYRIRQYIPALRDHGIGLQEFHGRAGSYPPPAQWKRVGWAAERLAELVPACIASRNADVVLLQREFLSTYPTIEFLTGRPRLLDVDDSIHLLRDGRAARRLASICDRVLCGNDHLAEIYSRWNRDVAVLPTGVDTARYVPGKRREERALIVGWIGTSANHDYLLAIEDALSRVLAGPDVILRIVSNSCPKFRHLDEHQVEFRQWTAEGEVAAIQEFDIGLMPLFDSEWARGKCSYKMLQYMSCAIPVVVSPVGMNRQVLEKADVGLSASTDADWEEAIRFLLSDEKKRLEMGEMGRRVVEDHFSVERLGPLLAQHIRDMAGVRS